MSPVFEIDVPVVPVPLNVPVEEKLAWLVEVQLIVPAVCVIPLFAAIDIVGITAAVILNVTPVDQELAKLEGPTLSSPSVNTDLTNIVNVEVFDGPVLSVRGLEDPDASGVTGTVGADPPVQYA